MPVSLVEAQAAGLPCVLSNTISEQTKITDGFHPVSIKRTPSEWVVEMEKMLLKERQNTLESLKKSGFDIQENAKWLTQYYVNKYF